jgi:hypothetical protein
MVYALGAGSAEPCESFPAYEKPRRSGRGRPCAKTPALCPPGLKGKRAPWSAGTICTRLKTGKSLFACLASAGKIPADPFRDLPYPRIPERTGRNLKRGADGEAAGASAGV